MEYLVSAEVNGKHIESEIKAINSNQAWERFKFLNIDFGDEVKNISIENI